MSGSTVGYGRGVRENRTAALARTWWLLVLRGLAAVIFGVVAFLEPVAAVASLVFVYGIYAVVDGSFTVAAAIRAATHHGSWALLMLEGVSGIAVGAAALLLPAVFIGVAVYILAAWAIVTGVLLLATSFRLHAGRGGWLAGLGGLLSIVWGVLLLANPFAGAVVLTIWLAAYALIFGVTMIAFGLRLRRKHAV